MLTTITIPSPPLRRFQWTFITQWNTHLNDNECHFISQPALTDVMDTIPCIHVKPASAPPGRHRASQLYVPPSVILSRPLRFLRLIGAKSINITFASNFQSTPAGFTWPTRSFTPARASAHTHCTLHILSQHHTHH